MNITPGDNSQVYFTAPANNRLQTLDFWMTEAAQRNVTATFRLTDGSVPTATLNTASILGSDGKSHLHYSVLFASATDGQFLVVTISGVTAFGDQFQAAALSSPGITPNTYTVRNGLNPQDVVDFAKAADVLVFPSDFVWTGNLRIGNPMALRSAGVSLAAGLRVTRTEANGPKFMTPNGEGAINIPEGAHDVSIDGLELTVAPGDFISYRLLNIAPNYRPSLAVSDLPSDIRVTHCYIHGTPITLSTAAQSGQTATFYGNTRVGIYTDGNRVTVADSIISDIAFNGAEANGIFSTVGQYVTIDNNEIAANGENIILYAGRRI